ncbi:MAG: PilZ domain-containing protein [Deltaproteobacteria bacterium]|nr:PilZ domain-containing protein [Deltaproteobacteria bacterium]
MGSVTHPVLIKNVLRFVSEQKTNVYCELDHRKFQGTLAIQKENLEMSIPGMKPDSSCIKTGDTMTVSFQAGGQVYSFVTTIVSMTSHEQFLTSYPSKISKMGRRKCPRYAIPKDIHFFISFSDPQDTSTKMTGRVIDFNTTGLRFKLDQHKLKLSQYKSPIMYTLHLSPKKIIQVKGEVKHEIVHNDSYYYGLSFLNLKLSEQQELFQYILDTFYPSLTHRWEVEFDKFWGLLEDSGYLGEKDSVFFQGMQCQAQKVWGTLAKDPFKISQDLVYVRNGKPLGTISATRLYEKSWLFHQLAVHPKNIAEGTVHADLYLGAFGDFILNNPHIDFLMGFYNIHNTWHRKFFDYFGQTASDASKFYVEHFHLFEPLIPESPYVDPSYPWELATAVGEEKKWILKHIQKCVPMIIQEACNLDATSFEIPKTRKTYIEKGLARDRKLLILKKDREIVAFALLENATTGINIFNLLDQAFLFYLEETPQIQTLLVKGVMNHYRSLGKKSFLLLAQKENLEPYRTLRLQEICILKRAVFHRDLFYDYRDYLFLMFSKSLHLSALV